MFTKLLVPVFGLSVALGVPATSVAAPTHHCAGAPCALHQLNVAKVTPYRVEAYTGRGSVTRGASLFVPAKPGLTAEWIERQLRQHLVAMGSTEMANCPLDVAKVTVKVESGGTGFWVRLIASDAKTGQEVLRRAQLMLG